MFFTYPVLGVFLLSRHRAGFYHLLQKCISTRKTNQSSMPGFQVFRVTLKKIKWWIHHLLSYCYFTHVWDILGIGLLLRCNIQLRQKSVKAWWWQNQMTFLYFAIWMLKSIQISTQSLLSRCLRYACSVIRVYSLESSSSGTHEVVRFTSEGTQNKNKRGEGKKKKLFSSFMFSPKLICVDGADG